MKLFKWEEIFQSHLQKKSVKMLENYRRFNIRIYLKKSFICHLQHKYYTHSYKQVVINPI